MTILFDLSATQPNSGNDFHGGSEYAKVVFYQLCKKLSETVQLEVFYNPDNVIDTALVSECKSHSIIEYLCKNNRELNALLGKKQYDVFYTALPYSYHDLNIPTKTKFIYTVHGLRSTEYPWDNFILKYKKQSFKTHIKQVISLFFPNQWREYLMRKSVNNFNLLFTRTKNQIVVTVSLHSKYAINYFFPHIDSSSIEALYSPAKLLQDDTVDEKAVLDGLTVEQGKYILLIGGDREEKGAYRACKALHKLFLTNNNNIPDNFKVIILGVSREKFYRKLTRNSPRFIFSNYVPSASLEALYKNAHLFMYPTLNEGFGYPPLEAMKYGTLCACSANSAVTEICAGAVLYFNPLDEIEMGIRVLESFDKSIREQKASKMRKHFAEIHKKQDKDLGTLVDIIIGNIAKP
ncbi:MAG: glycosyltransferase [Treponemataceae bacterium]|nr:MAG: glycosyltransferase [Treponemataceae bacterium]